jgi:hypothetical protein
MFIGIFFVLLGLSIIIKVLFKVDLPVFRMMVAIFFIFLGIKMLTGVRLWSWTSPWSDLSSNTTVFGRGQMHTSMNSTGNQFKTVFGSSVIDLTEPPLMNVGDLVRTVEIESVFAETKVLINPYVPVHIRVQSIFAEAKMPDGNMVAFGSLNYRNGNDTTKLEIRADAVFGSIKFENAQIAQPPVAPAPRAQSAPGQNGSPPLGNSGKPSAAEDDEDKD